MVNQSVITKTHRTVFDKMELFLASHKEHQWSPYITTEESSLNTEINILGLVKAIERKVYIKINYEAGMTTTGLLKLNKLKFSLYI